ncbi:MULTISPECIES: cadherin-like beta sandwich domain-containing protein [unclassified Paenibacillus]|uniref:Cadherin-like beta sandwich domain-containing protein n=1 Tax=Paenibacillus provencensis TaxID=441151 RepID=A0ABW3PV69_9BACL|nr:MULTISPECIES: cadherin-like beta sandwich domain-containing protein [unclassified Paenibacillus]MCM3130216.1 cadherin-like beta sandwich domain-containing protein [Paenibacillus sp. MER 78]SDX71830.1 S-layer homology domain-containing protein [Paenibacillus sp. PDC88]SFS88968.1 S-layer homology domain-containing protein [Paenibacillus sp. 453mf]
MKSKMWSRFISCMLIFILMVTAAPISVFANSEGDSRLARVDFSTDVSLSSSFSPDNYSYTGRVSSTISSLTLTPYAMDSAVSIQVNGNGVINGATSSFINLNTGWNYIEVRVTSLRDNTVRSYSFQINREEDINNADLTSLVIENAEIDQNFKADVLRYTGKVLPSQTYVIVKPKAHSNTTVKVNGTYVGTTGYHLVDLNGGINTITVVVTASGGATNQYEIILIKPSPSSDAGIKSISVNSKSYSTNGEAFVTYIPEGTSSVDIQINTEDSFSTIMLNGQKVISGKIVNTYLKEGASVELPIEVIASNGTTTKSYKLYVIRQANTTASINGSSPESTSSGSGSTLSSSAVTVSSSGEINVFDAKGANAIVERSGSVRTYNVTLNTESISKAINDSPRSNKLVVDYSEMITLNDKLNLTIDSNLSSLLRTKNIPVKLMGSIGNVTVDLNKMVGWNTGGSISLGKVELGANFDKEYIPETNFIQFTHTGSPVIGANPFDIEIKVFTEGDLKFANVYGYDGAIFDVVMSTSGVNSKKASNVKAGNYIVMSFKKSFTDIKNHWSYTLIDFMAKKQLISGYPDDSFQPDRYVSRSEFTSMLVKALGDKMKTLNNSDEPFKDVEENDWYYETVNSAWKYGIVTGLSSLEFVPDTNITREQMASIAVRALKQIKSASSISDLQANNILSTYVDAKAVSSWARVEMATAINSKLIEGVGQNTLASQALATRAQAAAVVYKILDQIDAF